ncbi:MAG TPA: pitrilysin family protein [Planctomycetaceae bacterium]|nr:pitrilysin family protein [Planctomycetaceae bacterium]
MSLSPETFRLSNGLLVVVEPMPDVQSAAMTLLVPSGGVRDVGGKCGTAAILTEMFVRGAGGLSARELSAAMDNLGLQRSVGVGNAHVTFSAATTADRIIDALPLVGNMLTEPHLAEEEFDPARDLVEQSLMAMEDEPRQRLGKILRLYSYAVPWGNSADGELSDLSAITVEDVRRHYREFVVPNEAILGIAGNVDPKQIRETVEAAFGSWKSSPVPGISVGTMPQSPFHVDHDSAQTHIGLAWNTVPYRDDRYYEAWAAVSLLSGGMSSRLFTEVRERRGLCYAISASLSTLREEGRVFAYAGTTTERAQETLDVTVAEILRLPEGITEDELHRCKARAKSSLIMQQESTTSRASSLARDMYHLGRIVTLDEINARINALSTTQVRDFSIEYAPRAMVLITLGPLPLNPACVTALG